MPKRVTIDESVGDCYFKKTPKTVTIDESAEDCHLKNTEDCYYR